MLAGNFGRWFTRLRRGGNYGWSVVEGRQSTKPESGGWTNADSPSGDRTAAHDRVQRDRRIRLSWPTVSGDLVGAYIFGDWETRRIWAARFENGRLTEMPEIVKPNIRVSAFGEDNAGELYFVDYDSGIIYTLERNDVERNQYAVPDDAQSDGAVPGRDKDCSPHAGVVPFSPALGQWQDGAEASHFFAFPGLIVGHCV